MNGIREQGMDQMTAQEPWKVIVLFSIPSFLGNLFQQLYSMTDAVIIGRLVGIKELAGVGAAGAINFLIIGFATGITGGFSVITAQRVGAGDTERTKSSIAASFCLCAIITLLLTFFGVVTASPLLEKMNTPEDIFPYALRYMLIVYSGLGAAVYYNLIVGILRAIGDSRTPLYFLVLSSVLNIILDLAAVIWLHAGVTGVAVSTVFAQFFSAAVCHLYAHRKYPQISLEKRHFSVFFSEAWRHLRIGLPMALQFSVTAVGIMILQAYLNRFGSLVIAGYVAASKVENLVTLPFTTLAITMEVYCGQNYGAGNKARLRKGIRSSIFMGLGTAVFAALISVFLGRQFIGLFLDHYDARVVEYGYQYLLIIAVFFWLLCSLQILRSALQGMEEALVPLAGGVIELIARWAGCIIFIPYAGYAGACLSTPLAWGLALILLLIRFARIMK